MPTHASRCRVCGWRGEDDVCPRCGTVLLRGHAMCRECGKVFEGPLAVCDACGGEVGVPPVPGGSEAIARLARLPGINESAAKTLYARGFADPSDVLKLALPDRAVRLGLHHSLTRKITLGELRPARHVRKTIPCPTCGAPRDTGSPRCPACGSGDVPWARPEDIARQLAEVAGDVVNLTADPDFRGMPEPLREEILDAFESAGIGPSPEGEYEAQIREWQARGFDTRELERMLREDGPGAFRANFVRMIRAQLMKRHEGDRFMCPICMADLEPAAPECENCGAKFR